MCNGFRDPGRFSKIKLRRASGFDRAEITRPGADIAQNHEGRFDPAGKLTLQLGVPEEAGCDATHFYQPTHVCVVATGEFFVTDGYGNSRVMKFSRVGRLLSQWGSRGWASGQFHTPHAITVDTSGRLYVTDRENDRIQVFDQAGTLVGLWDDLHSVDGIFAARDGLIYGSAGLDAAVIQFDENGRTLQVWAEPGQFHYPHGICVDGEGNFFVAEIAGDRVVKLVMRK
ncbi:MAG: repeat domain protein [Verrucomicrobia bacterium]|nr:repeat domain protein [Verrucomicrobiota bacterium]